MGINHSKNQRSSLQCMMIELRELHNEEGELLRKLSHHRPGADRQSLLDRLTQNRKDADKLVGLIRLKGVSSQAVMAHCYN